MDAILYWNAVALEANRVSHSNGKNEQTGPTLSARALAIVHLAMYDAFAGASGNPPGLPPYLPGLPPAGANASVDAAVAAAAHATLSALFPSQEPFFDLIYDPTYSPVGVAGPGLKKGRDFGLLVAQQLLAARQNDPGAGDAGYVPSTARGRHRPDPDNPGQSFHAPFFGAGSRCFASKRYALAPPPAVSTAPGDYRRALRQVRGKGIAPELMGTVPEGSRRTENETVIGLYWAYDGPVGLGTPPRLYNQIVRRVARNVPNPSNPGGAPNTAAQNARLFALVNAAMGDAAILAWEQKYLHDLWRPVVGIREHDPSMGPTGTAGNVLDDQCDSGWLPLGAPKSNSGTMEKNFTPPFPAYPSGHATFGAAAFHIARRFYGLASGNKGPDALFDNLSFVSEELNGVTRDNKGAVRPRHVRNFPGGLWTMIEENGRSRVFLGVHWVFDAFAVDANDQPDLGRNVDLANLVAGVGGVPLGLAIADDVFDTGLVAANGAGPSAPAPEASVTAPRAWPLG